MAGNDRLLRRLLDLRARKHDLAELGVRADVSTYEQIARVIAGWPAEQVVAAEIALGLRMRPGNHRVAASSDDGSEAYQRVSVANETMTIEEYRLMSAQQQATLTERQWTGCGPGGSDDG